MFWKNNKNKTIAESNEKIYRDNKENAIKNKEKTNESNLKKDNNLRDDFNSKK